ncbi:MAG: DUF1592 domain-containing protein, partial [Planctomycetaceae bacterium]|nr:DUF1592 domain-containing protein [Planctomycetaceae bacterium]
FHSRAEDVTGARAVRDLIHTHCLHCHDDSVKEGGLSLEHMNVADIAAATDDWEKILRKLTQRVMPPPGTTRPSEEEFAVVIDDLQRQLDTAAESNIRPGRTDAFRRLTRTEYSNAIRDLLGLSIDVERLLPPDEASHGFDNITVSNLSPTLLNRYIAAAQQLSQLAVGAPVRSPAGHTVRLRADLTQEDHVVGLPVGTRGGVLFEYNFPLNGVYEIQVRLMRDRNEHVEGLKTAHELEVLLDRERIGRFTLKPPRSNVEHANIDADLNVRLTVSAGPHDVGATFVQQTASLLESKRQPYDAHFNFYRHPRLSPAIYEVSITGPHEIHSSGRTLSRERIFGSASTSVAAEGNQQEADRAREIIRRLLRRAYRRSITDDDLQQPWEFYSTERSDGGSFEQGIQAALRAILVNPHFLFRVERDPPGLPPQTAYRTSSFELASRLSFFLWSSLPDDELLDLAESIDLSTTDDPPLQVYRMLRDERSQSLVTNFASQWLYLRNLDSMTPDLRTFPDFDDNLRQAFRQETELFFESILREDRSVLDLLHADYTFLNERLAKHYDIPHIYGSRFRRVDLRPEDRRGGLLRNGSILMATSYATRTSPVLRGKWILENLLGSPPPPPPENVPPLEDNTVAADLPVRQRLAAHRAHAACAGCHNLIDPVGLALENFDAVGRWRELESGLPVDASGGLPDGTDCVGVAELEQGMLHRPDVFVQTLVEKLLTYALGRGIEPSDAPAIRRIVRDAKADDYRFSSVIIGIVNSAPFRMRTTQ